MKRSKIIFLILAGLFLLAMIVIGYDISRRTTWPGASNEQQEQVVP